MGNRDTRFVWGRNSLHIVRKLLKCVLEILREIKFLLFPFYFSHLKTMPCGLYYLKRVNDGVERREKNSGNVGKCDFFSWSLSKTVNQWYSSHTYKHTALYANRSRKSVYMLNISIFSILSVFKTHSLQCLFLLFLHLFHSRILLGKYCFSYI